MAARWSAARRRSVQREGHRRANGLLRLGSRYGPEVWSGRRTAEAEAGSAEGVTGDDSGLAGADEDDVVLGDGDPQRAAVMGEWWLGGRPVRMRPAAGSPC